MSKVARCSKHRVSYLVKYGCSKCGPLRPPEEYRFSGATYDPVRDRARLTGQILRVFDVIKDHGAHTVHEIAEATGDPENSIQAQLRNMRKVEFGSLNIRRRWRAGSRETLSEYWWDRDEPYAAEELIAQ